MTSAKPILQYENKIQKMVEESRKEGTDPSYAIWSGLSRSLGDTSARTVLYYIGTKALDDPKVLVEKLTNMFDGGAETILRRMTDNDERGNGDLASG